MKTLILIIKTKKILIKDNSASSNANSNSNSNNNQQTMSAAVVAAALNAANGQLFLKNAADLLNYSNILSTSSGATTTSATQSASNSSLSSTSSSVSSSSPPSSNSSSSSPSSSSSSSSSPLSNEASSNSRRSTNSMPSQSHRGIATTLEQLKAFSAENQKLLPHANNTNNVIINKFNNLHLLQSIVNGSVPNNNNSSKAKPAQFKTNNNSSYESSTIELSPLSASSSTSSVSSSSPSSSSLSSSSSSSSSSASSFNNTNFGASSDGQNFSLVPEALQRLMTSDLMYKCTETNLMESIRSIKVDLNASDVCQVSCDLLEKWCFLMVDWARQSLYFKDIKVIKSLEIVVLSRKNLLT